MRPASEEQERSAVALIQVSAVELPVPVPVLAAGGRQRLAGRHLRMLAARPLLAHLIERLRSARAVRQVVVAASVLPEEEPLLRAGIAAGAAAFRGSLHDITGRLLACAEWLKLGDSSPIVRVSADAVLVDPRYVDAGVQALQATRGGAFEFIEDQAEELCSGLGASFLTVGALRYIDRRARTREHRSDPMTYAYEFPEEVELRRLPLPPPLGYLLGRHRFLCETAEDLAVIEALHLRLYQGAPVDTAAAVRLLDADPVLASLNQGVLRRATTLALPGPDRWRQR